MKRGIVAILLLAPVLLFAYTSPGKPTGFVNDFAAVLTAAEKAELERTLSEFEKQSGNEIAIAIVPSLEGDTEQYYAVKLFEEWGIGKKGRDNGLLILHAPNERKIWIEVGYGLEPYITDAKASSIYRNILSPEFKKGSYAEGYRQAVAAIIATLAGQTNAIPEDGPIIDSWGLFVYLLFIVLMWLASILGRSKSWWLGGVLGAGLGVIIGFIAGFLFVGIISIAILGALGLLFDFIVSRSFSSRYSKGQSIPWWIGGGHGGSGGFGGGGFGGFGGGRSGGGGGGGGY